jgi:hypothetical protein
MRTLTPARLAAAGLALSSALLSARALIASALLRTMIDQSGSIIPSILQADQLMTRVIWRVLDPLRRRRR